MSDKKVEKTKDGTVKISSQKEAPSDLYEKIQTMSLRALAEILNKDKPSLSITSNRITLMSSVVRCAIELMHRNGAKDLSIKVHGDIVQMSFRHEADNVALADKTFIYPFVIKPKLSKSKKVVSFDLNSSRMIEMVE